MDSLTGPFKGYGNQVTMKACGPLLLFIFGFFCFVNFFLGGGGQHYCSNALVICIIHVLFVYCFIDLFLFLLAFTRLADRL